MFEDALDWWARVGSQKFRWLSCVARSVFGHPLTVAPIEADFSMAGQILTSRRSRQDAAYAEVVLYLNLNLDQIPNLIPEIDPRDASEHLPARPAVIDSLDRSIVSSDDEAEEGPRVDALKA